ncbi:hypothetical protein [Shewanella sediminis]|uniref:hypothetical protein n=1 Tax=Shewanella sediminis TaxID=271097 RepID=UPI000157240D|nr:hypothetical protein [Shewanella sediminis]
MSLNSYVYSHGKSFLKNPECTHSVGNIRGQVYEASFYEWLITNMEKGQFEDYKLIAKPPYSKPINKCIGFQFEKDGSLIYSSNGISLFEFDAIISSKDKIMFYECFLSTWTRVRKNHEKDCLRKLNFLEQLFPNTIIECTVVSDNKKTLDRFSTLDKFHSLIHSNPKIDLLELVKKNKPKSLPQKHIMISPLELNKRAVSFDYFTQQSRLSNRLISGAKLTDISKE